MSEDGQALFDIAQAQTALEHAAMIFATYYQALVVHGIPSDLAAALTSDYAESFWNDIRNVSQKNA